MSAPSGKVDTMRNPELPPPPGGKRRKSANEPGRGSQHVSPRLTAEVNPGEARWCEQHRKLECTRVPRRKAEGEPCHNGAIRGRDHCKMHSMPVGRRKAIIMGEAQITAWSAVTDDGRVRPGVHVDPGQAVLAQLQMAWFRAGAYGELLRKQVTRESEGQLALEGVVLDETGQEVEPGGMSTAGLVGHKYSATNDGSIYATSEEVRALVQLEADERDRVVKYAATAHKMGISDRMTDLAERWGDVTAGRIVSMLDELELTPEQQSKVAMLVQKHLSSIDLTGIGQ